MAEMMKKLFRVLHDYGCSLKGNTLRNSEGDLIKVCETVHAAHTPPRWSAMSQAVQENPGPLLDALVDAGILEKTVLRKQPVWVDDGPCHKNCVKHSIVGMDVSERHYRLEFLDRVQYATKWETL